MSLLHHKTVAILLSLLLGLLPLQGLFAAEASMNALGNATDAPIAVAMDHGQIPEMSQACEQASCCDGSSCGADHCASCALAAVPMDSSMILPLPVAINLTGLAPRVLNSTLSFLYRPPRA